MSFETKELRDICERPNVATRLMGSNPASKLYARIADVTSSESLADLDALGIFSQNGNDGSFVISLSEGWKIVFTKQREVEWVNVTRIKVSEIKHDR